MNYVVGAQRVLEGERGTEMKTMGARGGIARLRLKDSPLAFLRRFQSDFFR